MSETLDVKKFTVYDDGGHCYCAVPLELLRELRISKLISGFSYIDHNAGIVYIEEDCDMAIFCERMKADGIKFELEEEWVEVDEDSDSERWVHQFDSYEGDDDCEEDQNTDGIEQWVYGEDEDTDYCDSCFEHISDCECEEEEDQSPSSFLLKKNINISIIV